MAGKKGHRSFGYLRKLPSGRWQASYQGPDLTRHKAPSTFHAKVDAEGWLTDERRIIERGDWRAPSDRQRATVDTPVTLGEYAGPWLTDRTLKPRTRQHYGQLLERHILPTFATVPLKGITPQLVRSWHARLLTDRPTLRAHAYALLRTILQSALQDGEINANPCHIRGAGNAKRASKTEPATLDQLATIVETMPERYRLMVLLAAWCSLRYGEVTELRRKDIDLTNGVLRVRRAVTRVNGEFVVGTPKSDAGTRDVAIPPHLLPVVREHLAANMTGKDGLLFPSASDPTKHLMSTAMQNYFVRAREAAGRPDLRFHDLRHTGAVLAAQTGATLAELMGRLGHSTPAAAMRYQHAAQGRDAQIAAALSAMAEANTP